MTTRSKGFTLIEIMVAVSIIAILAVIGVISYASVNRKSRDAKRKSDLEQVRSALELYRADNGYYPNANSSGGFGAMSALESAISPNYIPKTPTDPKDTGAGPTYQYKPTNYSNDDFNYYGYCVCANLETLTATSTTCDAADTSTECNYYMRNP